MKNFYLVELKSASSRISVYLFYPIYNSRWEWNESRQKYVFILHVHKICCNLNMDRKMLHNVPRNTIKFSDHLLLPCSICIMDPWGMECFIKTRIPFFTTSFHSHETIKTKPLPSSAWKMSWIVGSLFLFIFCCTQNEKKKKAAHIKQITRKKIFVKGSKKTS